MALPPANRMRNRERERTLRASALGALEQGAAHRGACWPSHRRGGVMDAAAGAALARCEGHACAACSAPGLLVPAQPLGPSVPASEQHCDPRAHRAERPAGPQLERTLSGVAGATTSSRLLFNPEAPLRWIGAHQARCVRPCNFEADLRASRARRPRASQAGESKSSTVAGQLHPVSGAPLRCFCGRRCHAPHPRRTLAAPAHSHTIMHDGPRQAHATAMRTRPAPARPPAPSAARARRSPRRAPAACRQTRAR